LQSIGDDGPGLAVPLQHLPKKVQSHRFVAFLGDLGFQNLAYVVYRPPQTVHLAVDLHMVLVEVPFPVTEAAHSVDPLAAEVGGEHRPEPIPPQPHGFMAETNPALEQKILNVPRAQRETPIQHDHEADPLGR
jgi:hypothetical protein